MKINEAAAAAEDRDHWREILRATNPSSMLPPVWSVTHGSLIVA